MCSRVRLGVSFFFGGGGRLGYVFTSKKTCHVCVFSTFKLLFVSWRFGVLVVFWGKGLGGVVRCVFGFLFYCDMFGCEHFVPTLCGLFLLNVFLVLVCKVFMCSNFLSFHEMIIVRYCFLSGSLKCLFLFSSSFQVLFLKVFCFFSKVFLILWYFSESWLNGFIFGRVFFWQGFEEGTWPSTGTGWCFHFMLNQPLLGKTYPHWRFWYVLIFLVLGWRNHKPEK